jgi:hypothetical protein
MAKERIARDKGIFAINALVSRERLGDRRSIFGIGS